MLDVDDVLLPPDSERAGHPGLAPHARLYFCFVVYGQEDNHFLSYGFNNFGLYIGRLCRNIVLEYWSRDSQLISFVSKFHLCCPVAEAGLDAIVSTHGISGVCESPHSLPQASTRNFELHF